MYLLNCLAKDHKTLKPLNIWGPRTICITMAGQRRINLLYAFYLTFTKDFRHISAAGNLPGDSRIPDPRLQTLLDWPCQHLHTNGSQCCST